MEKTTFTFTSIPKEDIQWTAAKRNPRGTCSAKEKKRCDTEDNRNQRDPVRLVNDKTIIFL